MIGPELVFVAGAVAAAVGGALALRSERRASIVTADEFAGRLALHPARGLAIGSGRVVAGEHLVGMAAAPAPVVEATITSVPARSELDGRPQCQGTLTVHRDSASTTCHGGELDCWGDDGLYSHRSRADCRDAAHGCGTCSVVGAS